MSETPYQAGKLSAYRGKWVALAFLFSVVLNVKFLSDIGNARKEAEQQQRRTVVATQGLKSTAHLLYLLKRDAIADSCAMDILLQGQRRTSEEFKRAVAEVRKAEENAGIECRQLEPERSESETAKLVEEKIQEEMRKLK